MRLAQYQARSARIDRVLAQNAELRRHAPRAAHFTTFVLGFVIPCMAIGAVIVATMILLTKIYLS